MDQVKFVQDSLALPKHTFRSETISGTERPLYMMKYAFYCNLKSLFGPPAVAGRVL